MRQGQDGCLCLEAPVRALSRAADSAFDLYVRGMSWCASRVPLGAVPGGRGAAFGRSAATVYKWASSDRREDLVRAAPKQRRVAAPEPVDVGAAQKGRLSRVAPELLTARRRATPMLGTIAEDAPCEFGACALRPPELRRSAAVDGLGTRAGGFPIDKSGSGAFARRTRRNNARVPAVYKA
ncbi:hypothetical protein ACQ4PT_067638 [Festuca glaucescens]